MTILITQEAKWGSIVSALETTEVCFMKRMLKIQRISHMKNEGVLDGAGTQQDGSVDRYRRMGYVCNSVSSYRKDFF